jgi:hypothetical protein
MTIQDAFNNVLDAVNKVYDSGISCCAHFGFAYFNSHNRFFSAFLKAIIEASNAAMTGSRIILNDALLNAIKIAKSSQKDATYVIKDPTEYGCYIDSTKHTETVQKMVAYASYCIAYNIAYKTQKYVDKNSSFIDTFVRDSIKRACDAYISAYNTTYAKTLVADMCNPGYIGYTHINYDQSSWSKTDFTPFLEHIKDCAAKNAVRAVFSDRQSIIRISNYIAACESAIDKVHILENELEKIIEDTTNTETHSTIKNGIARIQAQIYKYK